jgi:putative peptidoglycan lipid II flippase
VTPRDDPPSQLPLLPPDPAPEPAGQPAAAASPPPAAAASPPAAAAGAPPARDRTMTRAAGVISLATFVSRLLGLVREQVFAAQFGAGFAVDAFQVAFRVPNLLRDLFAEGAMSAAFVPTLARAQERGGPQAAVRLANLVLNFLVVAISALCIVGILASDWIVRALAPGFANVPGKIELTAMMTRIMTPFLLLVSLAAACMGFLNTRRVFFIPALAPTMLNLGLILAGYLIAPLMPRFGLEPIVGMAFGALLGGLGQMLIQVPWMKAQGFHWEPIVNFKDPDVLRMVTLMAPAALGIAAAQVNIFVSTFLASQLQQGSVSWLNYAYRLMQLPIGLFGVAIATVTLAEVAKHAAQKNMVGLKETLSFSLGLVLFLTLPATVALVALAKPIVALLYQHGRFTPTDTMETAHALWAYAVGLAAFSAVRVMVPAFYSLGMARIPVTISMITIGLTLILYFALMGPLHHAGLALATSLGSVINFTMLFLMLRRKIGGIGGRALARSAGKIVLAAGLAGGAAWGAAMAAEHAFGLQRMTGRLLVVAAGLGAMGLVYAGAALFLRVREMKAMVARFARR